MNRSAQWLFEAYLPAGVSDDAVRAAAACALGVSADRVLVVADKATTSATWDVLVVRLTDAAPMDPVFPATIRVSSRLEAGNRVDVAQGISSALGMAIVADVAPADLQDDWMLLFPDGTTRLITINDDEAFVLSQRDLVDIAHARLTASRAA